MGRRWGWATVLVTMSLLRGWGSEPKLTSALPTVYADPIPVRIEAPPTPETRTDYLEWRTRGVVYRLPIPRTPDAPARREVACYTLVLQHGLAWAPLFYWREGNIPKPLADDRSAQGVGVVFVGDLIGGYEFLAGVEYAPITLPNYPRHELNAETFPLTPVYLRPEALPNHPVALLGVPFVVLMDGAERLSEIQWRALIAWMHAGGTLIVPVSASASLLRRTPLASYLPESDALRVQPIAQPIALQGEPLPPPSEPVPVSFLRLTRGEPFATVGNRILAGQIPHGYGRLIVFGGDLRHPAWRTWRASASLWAALLSRPQLPILTLSQVEETRAADATPGRPDERLNTFPIIVGILMGYITALYGLWRLLRRQRRLIYAPYGVAALSGLTLLALYFATPAPADTMPLQGKRQLVCVGDIALEYGWWEYRAPSGEWTLRWQHADALAVEPVAALNPIEVEFTGQGATLRSGSLIPAVIRLHTLRQMPAPLRLRKTPQGYVLHNTSEHLTFEIIRVARYRTAAHNNNDFWQAWDWEPFMANQLGPGAATPFPYDPLRGYAVNATARGASEKEQVEVWLFLP